MGYFEKIYQSDLSHRARAVYMYLKDHADSEGKCWPGIRTISAELRLSRSTVKRALDDLCTAALISREFRWRENGSHSSVDTGLTHAEIIVQTRSRAYG